MSNSSQFGVRNKSVSKGDDPKKQAREETFSTMLNNINKNPTKEQRGKNKHTAEGTPSFGAKHHNTHSTSPKPAANTGNRSSNSHNTVNSAGKIEISTFHLEVLYYPQDRLMDLVLQAHSLQKLQILMSKKFGLQMILKKV